MHHTLFSAYYNYLILWLNCSSTFNFPNRKQNNISLNCSIDTYSIEINIAVKDSIILLKAWSRPFSVDIVIIKVVMVELQYYHEQIVWYNNDGYPLIIQFLAFIFRWMYANQSKKKYEFTEEKQALSVGNDCEQNTKLCENY